MHLRSCEPILRCNRCMDHSCVFIIEFFDTVDTDPVTSRAGHDIAGSGHADIRSVIQNEFFYEHTGMTHAPITTEDWLATPQMHLAEAVNGKVFRDPSGEFTAIRNTWKGFYPEDILKKKVAADLAMAGKTGQFNYDRSIKRGDIGAAYYCVTEFIYKISAALFLLNGRYMPYYKWRFRAMKDFTTFSSAVEPLMKLCQMSEEVSSDKIDLIEEISGLVIKELVGRGWSSGHSDYLLDNAKLVMKTINNSEIASWNVFVGED